MQIDGVSQGQGYTCSPLTSTVPTRKSQHSVIVSDLMQSIKILFDLLSAFRRKSKKQTPTAHFISVCVVCLDEKLKSPKKSRIKTLS